MNFYYQCLAQRDSVLLCLDVVELGVIRQHRRIPAFGFFAEC